MATEDLKLEKAPVERPAPGSYEDVDEAPELKLAAIRDADPGDEDD